MIFKLTFDIDINDYKYKFCCQPISICGKCWIILQTAAKIIEVILLKHFALKKLIFGKKKNNYEPELN